jgi:RNA polymerase sigma factor (sigma-70 family)
VAHGDEVIAALARERGPALVAYAYLLSGSRRDAEDLVQDALVKTVLRARAGVDLRTAEGYVRRTVLTTYLDARRRSRRWLDALPRLAADADRTAPDPADAATARRDVQAALALLTPRQRACVVLRYVDDMTVTDVAAELGLSTGTVKRYLAEARGRLGPALTVTAGRPAHDDEEHVR